MIVKEKVLKAIPTACVFFDQPGTGRRHRLRFRSEQNFIVLACVPDNCYLTPAGYYQSDLSFGTLLSYHIASCKGSSVSNMFLGDWKKTERAAWSSAWKNLSKLMIETFQK